MKYICILAFALNLITSLTSNLAFASQADLQKEENHYSDVFSGSNTIKQRSVMQRLVWSGFSSPMIFDSVAQKLSNNLETEDKEKVENASWHAKTLALSGNSKYRALLTQASTSAKSSKLKKHAKLSLDRLNKYVKWNPIISQGLTSAPNGQLEQTRVANMLNADDYELVRLGAKRAYKEFSDNTQIVSIVIKRLESEVNISKNEDMRIDATAWMLKVIGGTGNSQYKDVLETVIANNKNKKVRKYAKKAMKSL